MFTKSSLTFPPPPHTHPRPSPRMSFWSVGDFKQLSPVAQPGPDATRPVSSPLVWEHNLLYTIFVTLREGPPMKCWLGNSQLGFVDLLLTHTPHVSLVRPGLHVPPCNMRRANLNIHNDRSLCCHCQCLSPSPQQTVFLVGSKIFPTSAIKFLGRHLLNKGTWALF